jgi:hypothetical protein
MMQAGVRTIHVYKEVFSDGQTCFTNKTKDDRGSVSCATLHVIAENARFEKDSLLGNLVLDVGLVSIDFTPFHDIECPFGLAPRRCVPLSADEQLKFWQYFTQEKK